jgi:hypothetical protein
MPKSRTTLLQRGEDGELMTPQIISASIEMQHAKEIL